MQKGEEKEMSEKSETVKRLEALPAYEIVEAGPLEDIGSQGYLLRHKKTGARVALVENGDENKVFCIGFRTPPADSTGVAHILEHSVLCGSKEFPIKDPFVELVKGSLNTFLNAMTYPDKTLYPIASCNDKDFQNLMHVYLDAVFYPRIYQIENIFRQEGWHYELESPEDELKVNGVVYNEMKGAFSSPDEVLTREIMNSLYPDTPYGTESGGDPRVIPQLTYEAFLDFHRKYYHPANSYIYLYGNMDMAEKLDYIDKAYLSRFEALSVDSGVSLQAPFEKERREEKEYPVSDGAEAAQGGYLSWSAAVGESLDRELCLAFQVLDYALCSAPGAPLKQALVDRGLGKDVYSIYDNELRQPFFGVISKGVSLEKEQEFLSVIREVLEGLVREGFDKKALLAGINYYEFKYREADFGSAPKGLIYGLEMLSSWLYDETKPFLYLEAGQVYRTLRRKVQEGYFEDLIRRYLLENPHRSVVVLRPVEGLAARQEREQKEAMARLKESLSPGQIQEIVDRTKELRAYQEAEDPREDLERIPLLTREDIGREARKLVNRSEKLGDVPVLWHPIFTSGIGYLRMIFRLDQVPERLYPYVGVLKGCLGLLNTEHYSYGDLFNEINIETGGISAVTNVYTKVEDPENYTATLEIKGKALYEKLPRAIELMSEILTTSDFGDTKRLSQILAEGKVRMQAQMLSAGHRVASGRALSYGSSAGCVEEVLSGVDFYRLIAGLEEHFEERKQELAGALKELAATVFRRENLTVDFVGDQEGFQRLEGPVAAFAAGLYETPVEKGSFHPLPVQKNEGFMTAGQVQYVSRAGNFRKKGLPYRGALLVLKVMMGYDYLWNNIRVKGGAYGCMCGFASDGDSYFVSYRDPNLKKTVEVFEKAAQSVEAFEADERTMTQYIIGAVSDLDLPMNPAAYGLFSQSSYFSGVTQEMLQKERDEVLGATAQDIRELAAYIRAFMEEKSFCVVGSAERIREDAALFAHTENLY